MSAVTTCSDFGAQENKVLSPFPLFPHLFAVKWWDQMPWSLFFECWVLSQLFSISSFTFTKRLFSSLLSAIRVVSLKYLRLLIFLPIILISACTSSSPTFCMMYSACKLNKQGDNIQPWRAPFPIWSQSVFPFPVLTVASWPAYRFLKRQVRWSGMPISFRIFHSLLWSTHVTLKFIFVMTWKTIELYHVKSNICTAYAPAISLELYANEKLQYWWIRREAEKYW